MKKQIIIALFVSITSINSTTFCSSLLSNMIKRNFSVSKKDAIVHHLNRIIQTIKRDDPSNQYMKLAEQSMKESSFDKAGDYIKAHYCNETYNILKIARNRKEQTEKLLQEQIKYRLRQENLDKKA